MKPNPLFYWLVRNTFQIILRVYNRCSVRWLEDLDPDERVVVACNHASNLDPLVVGSFLDKIKIHEI